jgi:hypothetical protein
VRMRSICWKRGGGRVFETACERARVAGGRWWWSCVGGFLGPQAGDGFAAVDPGLHHSPPLSLLPHLGKQLLADLDAQALVQ